MFFHFYKRIIKWISFTGQILNWLCFYNIKSYVGTVIGIIFSYTIGLFWSIVIGGNLMGGWTAEFLEWAYEKTKIGSYFYQYVLLLGIEIGIFFLLFIFLILGSNIGNYSGFLIKVFLKKFMNLIGNMKK